MSVMRCDEHDLHYDTDFVETCEVCEGRDVHAQSRIEERAREMAADSFNSGCLRAEEWLTDNNADPLMVEVVWRSARLRTFGTGQEDGWYLDVAIAKLRGMYMAACWEQFLPAAEREMQ